MPKLDANIEIVSSSQKDLSSMSQISRQAVLKVLSKYYTNVRITLVDELADLEALVTRRPDVVFLGMSFIPNDPLDGRNSSNGIWLSEYFDAHRIAYTGSPRQAHELERNKSYAKQAIFDACLATSPYFVTDQNQEIIKEDGKHNFPLFVKPSNCGGGLGIDSDSVVHNYQQLHTKIAAIASDFGSTSLVEDYLPGKEYSVAILKEEDTQEVLLMPLELVAPADANGERFLGKTVKEANDERFYEIQDAGVKEKVETLAIGAFEVLGGRDYGRIDIRMDKFGQPNFLEANLIPSLIAGYGSLPKACLLNNNLDHEEIILRILRLGLSRSENTTAITPVLRKEYGAFTVPA